MTNENNLEILPHEMNDSSGHPLQPTLHVLNLNDNNIKSEGAMAIFGVASAMQELTTLKLSKNNINCSCHQECTGARI